MVGIATGFLLFIGCIESICSYIRRRMGLLVISIDHPGFGIVVAWRSKQRPWLDKNDLKSWPQILALGILSWLFFQFNLGWVYLMILSSFR